MVYGAKGGSYMILLGPACLSSWVGAKMDENSIYGKFHWTHKSDFFNFSIGVPVHEKQSRDEITIITGTGKIPKRKDTICGSPSLFSFIATKSKDSKNDAFDAVCRVPSSKGP